MLANTTKCQNSTKCMQTNAHSIYSSGILLDFGPTNLLRWTNRPTNSHYGYPWPNTSSTHTGVIRISRTRNRKKATKKLLIKQQNSRIFCPRISLDRLAEKSPKMDVHNFCKHFLFEGSELVSLLFSIKMFCFKLHIIQQKTTTTAAAAAALATQYKNTTNNKLIQLF